MQNIFTARGPTHKYTIKQILGSIDHAVLKQDAKIDAVESACSDAVKYGFYSVIVFPYYTALTARLLEGSGVLCGAVVGFPFGNNLTEIKVMEAQRALDDGARELDMVMALSAFKNGDYKLVEKDIAAVVKQAEHVPVKVIIESPLLTDSEIVRACGLCADAGAAFAKTATGFFGGATEHAVKLMHSAAAGRIAIKASGGIRSAEDAAAMLRAGAVRLGTSAGVAIAEGGAANIARPQLDSRQY